MSILWLYLFWQEFLMGARGSPVAGVSSPDTLPLQMLTQRILNSNIACGSFIVKYRRSHIFPHRNIGTGCRHRSRSLFRGRSFAPLRMIPENKQTSPARKAARAGFPIRGALGRRRHLATGEPKAKLLSSWCPSRDPVGRGASVEVVGEEVFAGSRSRPRLCSDRDPRQLTDSHNPSSSPDPSGKALLPESKPPAQVQSGSRAPHSED